MPSDAQLCEEFAVSRMTARGAMQRLVHEGLVYRVPGRGTFVAPARASRTASRILSFTDEMRRSGRVAASRVVERHVRASTPTSAAAWTRPRCSSSAAFARRTGSRSRSRPRCSPPAGSLRSSSADLGSASLFETLADAGLVPTAGHATITAEAASSEDARLLGVRKGSPLLVERRLISDQDDAPLELTESRYVAERYDIDVDFEVELP